MAWDMPYTPCLTRGDDFERAGKEAISSKGMTEQFDLFERVERLSPEVFEQVKGCFQGYLRQCGFLFRLCV